MQQHPADAPGHCHRRGSGPLAGEDVSVVALLTRNPSALDARLPPELFRARRNTLVYLRYIRRAGSTLKP
ncbi:hypothetical protein [Burkholderia metallica]|uniref:hypothetical protein n=1 Tax=Burkholderia metallica TaxID=488729 RepID=UPI001ABF1199|nr:hypothetical protein [Burkholderia metallica]